MDDRESSAPDGMRRDGEPAGDAPDDMGPDTARSKTIATPGGIPVKDDIGVHGAAEGELDKALPGSGAHQDAVSSAEKAFRGPE